MAEAKRDRFAAKHSSDNTKTAAMRTAARVVQSALDDGDHKNEKRRQPAEEAAMCSFIEASESPIRGAVAKSGRRMLRCEAAIDGTDTEIVLDGGAEERVRERVGLQEEIHVWRVQEGRRKHGYLTL